MSASRPSSGSARPSSGKQHPVKRPLLPAMQTAGLQQYGRKLDDMGFVSVDQVLKLGRGARLDEVLDRLRPMPGHRTRLLNFIEEERTRAQVARHGAGPAPNAKAVAPASVQTRVTRKAPTPKANRVGLTLDAAPASKQALGQKEGAPSPADEGGAALSGPADASARAADEAEAVAFLRQSWAREVLGDVSAWPIAEGDEAAAFELGHSASGGGPASSPVRLRRSHRRGAAPGATDGAEGVDASGVEADSTATRLSTCSMKGAALSATTDTVQYEDDFESDVEEGGGEDDGDQGKENATARVSASAAVCRGDGGGVREDGADTGAVLETESEQRRLVLAVQEQLRGGAPPPSPAVLLPLDFKPLDALASPRVPASKASLEPANEKRSRRRDGHAAAMLANSVEGHQAPSGLLSKPNGREVFESVSFVLHKHVQLQGRFLLLRAEPLAAAGPPMQSGTSAGEASAATAPAVDAVDAEAVDAACGSPLDPLPATSPRQGESPAGVGPGPESAVGGDEGASDESAEWTSPGPPAGVRNALLSGVNSMFGLRYSLDLSPVKESRAEALGASRLSARPNPLCPDSLAASALWEGGWAPPEGVTIFDERLHPLGGATPRPSTPRGTVEPPSLREVSNFVRNLSVSARMGTEASVVGLAYVERLAAARVVSVDAYTWRRVVVVAWLLAHKMFDDDCLENADFCEVFGFELADINALEGHFVAAVGFQLGLNAADYARYYFALRSICQVESDKFPLRPLDDDLEARLARRTGADSIHFARGQGRGAHDLRRSA